MERINTRNHCCRAKARNVTCSECVSVALVIHNERRMRRIILSSVTVRLYSIFPDCHKRHDVWGGKNFLNMK